MLRRSTKIQLVLFVIITLLGVSYVSAEYVGLTKGLFGDSSCTVKADFPDSGGIFTNAEVTYRGVTVGRVGALKLIPHGIEVNLDIDDCSGSKIPVDSVAQVSDRSVVGEQYVDLQPQHDQGPYFRGGETIPMAHNTIPTATQTLLLNLDHLVKSVNISDLQTTVSELGQVFNDRGKDLATLLDSTNTLVNAAQANIGPTLQLIDEAQTVLQTQLDEGPALKSFAGNLDLLAQQLKASDPDIRHLLSSAPLDLNTLNDFVKDNRTDFGITIANLAEVGDLLVRHSGSIEEVLELYPALAAGGPTALHDNKGALSDVAQTKLDPNVCGDPSKGQQGYEATVRRSPADLAPIAPNVEAHCTAPVSSGVDVRGAANVPGGDPISHSGGGVAYPRVTTKNLMVGTNLQNAYLMGDNSWQTILTDSLH